MGNGAERLGPRDLIVQARRIRKLFGGGMRQAGFMAAACLYALDHHIDRLAEDHANAWIIAEGVDRERYTEVMRSWVAQAYDKDGPPNPIHLLERGEAVHFASH